MSALVPGGTITMSPSSALTAFEPSAEAGLAPSYPETRIGPSDVFVQTRTEPLAFVTDRSHRASAASWPETTSDLFFFSQEDPATFGASSWQQYTYVHSSPLSLSDPHGEVPQAAAGAAVSGAIAAGSSILTGYLLEQILGDGCYTVDDALVDGLTGVIGYGVLSKVNKAWRLYKLRRIARAEGMVNKGLKGYVETWVHPSDALKKLDIKLAPAVSPNVQAGSKVPRFSFRIDAGVFRDPFTGAVGPKGALSHVPLEPPLSPGAAAAAGGVGSLLGPTSKADCGCLLSWR